MAVPQAAVMEIVVTVGFLQDSNTGTADTAIVACASVEVFVEGVLEIVYLLRQHLQEPGAPLREEHQALRRLKRSLHPCRISIAVL